MKLSHGFGLLAAGFGTAGLMAFAGFGGLTGCGSSSGGTGGGSSSGGSNAGAPPTPPSGPVTKVTKSHNYALHQLFLGDTDRTGVSSTSAWKTFGYNLDDKVTTTASTDVCTLMAGASKQVQADGENGIDNSFGANIIPIVTTLDATASMTLNNSIQSGSFTVFTYVTGFDDSAGNKTTATGLTGVLLAGGVYSTDGGMPTWDMNTNWPVLPDPGLISGCTAYPGGCPAGTDPLTNAKIKFGSAFQTGGTFVNGTPSPLTLTLGIGGQDLSLNIASAVISFGPDKPGSVTNGIIAGVLNTADLIDGLKKIAGNISASLCMGSAFQSIATQIEQTSDIINNGNQVSNTAGQACNAISIGLGFSSSEIAPPTTIAASTPPAPNKCADAGGGD